MCKQLVAEQDRMFRFAALLTFTLIAITRGQQIGTFTPEVHPALPFSQCTASGGCTSVPAGVTLDANYRWLHTASAQTCNPGGFNLTICPDPVTCSENCALDGANYAESYGVTTVENGINLAFGNVGARLYLLQSETEYMMIKPLNQEFSFDVDVSNLPCGMNGALYFSEMVQNGGMSATNVAGAAYGTGYCDAQCSGGTNFFNGTANIHNNIGACCNEMDLWEANSAATALTPHPCAVTGTFPCTGTQCSELCDPDGCDLNPFRLGAQSFYGPGLTVDTTAPFTVVTQFLTNDGTPDGDLAEIRRLYVQNGQVVQNAAFNTPGVPAGNSINQNFCNLKEAAFSDPTFFNTYGGLVQLGDSLKRGVVLVMSLWSDQGSGMLWLDGTFPIGSSDSTPGVFRGPCDATSGFESHPTSSVSFSNIKVGDFGSTFAASSCAESSSTEVATAAQYAQCGGFFFEGALTCECPFTCTVVNDYFSQCL